MREIFCNEKDCHVLPASQSSVEAGPDSISSLSDSTPSTVPLSSIKPKSRRGKKRKTRRSKSQRGGKVKRLRRVQVGGKRRRSKKTKSQRGGRKRKCIKRKR